MTPLTKRTLLFFLTIPYLFFGQKFIEKTTYKFNSKTSKYRFSKIQVDELNEKDQIIKTFNFTSGFLNGAELSIDTLYKSTTYYKYTTNKDTVFCFRSTDSLSWLIDHAVISIIDTLRITDLNINEDILWDSVIIKSNDKATKIYTSSLTDSYDFEKNKQNYSIKYRDFNFKNNLTNYQIRSTQDIDTYNQIRKLNNDEFSYKYKNNKLIELTIYDSPKIIYTKTIIKYINKFNFSKTLTTANRLYTEEKNCR